jgi:cytochrome c1
MDLFRRGYQVYKQVCAACHSMRYLAYRNLGELNNRSYTFLALLSTGSVSTGIKKVHSVFSLNKYFNSTF